MKCYDSTVHEKVQLSGDVPFFYIYIYKQGENEGYHVIVHVLS